MPLLEQAGPHDLGEKISPAPTFSGAQTHAILGPVAQTRQNAAFLLHGLVWILVSAHFVSMPSPTKAELRRIMREQLAGMTPAACAAASESIRTSIASLPRWQAARTIAAYAALPGEPDLQPLQWTDSKKVLLPRIEDDRLVFHAVQNADQLKRGAFGVMEPDPAQCPAVDTREMEIIFVPGLAFTSDGARLGRGRGFYDRLLADLPKTVLRAGVCFPCQISPELPAEPHDQEVDLVLTSSS
ncbi:MAG: 5-formyltetrahydrofolate cyclo-ligase [Chthoniobacterales bacterium]|nr:5-formyltetrahydrofolate cyclo-ligase [Chthoniobacterales bacterium]